MAGKAGIYKSRPSIRARFSELLEHPMVAARRCAEIHPARALMGGNGEANQPYFDALTNESTRTTVASHSFFHTNAMATERRDYCMLQKAVPD